MESSLDLHACKPMKFDNMAEMWYGQLSHHNNLSLFPSCDRFILFSFE